MKGYETKRETIDNEVLSPKTSISSLFFSISRRFFNRRFFISSEKFLNIIVCPSH